MRMVALALLLPGLLFLETVASESGAVQISTSEGLVEAGENENIDVLFSALTPFHFELSGLEKSASDFKFASASFPKLNCTARSRSGRVSFAVDYSSFTTLTKPDTVTITDNGDRVVGSWRFYPIRVIFQEATSKSDLIFVDYEEPVGGQYDGKEVRLSVSANPWHPCLRRQLELVGIPGVFTQIRYSFQEPRLSQSSDEARLTIIPSGPGGGAITAMLSQVRRDCGVRIGVCIYSKSAKIRVPRPSREQSMAAITSAESILPPPSSKREEEGWTKLKSFLGEYWLEHFGGVFLEQLRQPEHAKDLKNFTSYFRSYDFESFLTDYAAVVARYHSPLPAESTQSDRIGEGKIAK